MKFNEKHLRKSKTVQSHTNSFLAQHQLLSCFTSSAHLRQASLPHRDKAVILGSKVKGYWVCSRCMFTVWWHNVCWNLIDLIGEQVKDKYGAKEIIMLYVIYPIHLTCVCIHWFKTECKSYIELKTAYYSKCFMWNVVWFLQFLRK